MTERVELAHPPDTRQAALDALTEHGSLRRAAAAVAGSDGKGPSKSSVHRWKNKAATANAGTPTQTATDPLLDTDTQHDVDVDAQTGYAGLLTTPPVPTFADRLTDPNFLRALHRYLQLCATGTRPDIAWEGARVIDPYFDLSDDEDAQLRSAVERFTGAETERAIFAVGAPVWVSNVAQSFHFDPASTNDLLDALTTVRTDGYVAGINAGLTAHDRAPITDITDPALQRQIQLDTAATVNGVTKQWNADASAATWKAWYSISTDPSLISDADRQAALYGAMLDWRDGRLASKADQWSGDNAASGMYDAAQAFQQENQAGVSAWVEPQDASCDICQEMVDMSSEQDLADADTMLALDLPAHSRCPHYLVVVQVDVPVDQSLWGEDLGPTSDSSGDATPAPDSSSGDEAA